VVHSLVIARTENFIRWRIWSVSNKRVFEVLAVGFFVAWIVYAFGLSGILFLAGLASLVASEVVSDEKTQDDV
jgi:hypothetical protein